MQQMKMIRILLMWFSEMEQHIDKEEKDWSDRIGFIMWNRGCEIG